MTDVATGGEWRPFPGDTRYEVCSLGAVRNTRTGHVLKPWLAGYGYWYVQLGAKGLKTGIHRLVALTFLGPPPSPLHEVAHSDGNRHNNAITNLRWATHAQNVPTASCMAQPMFQYFEGNGTRVPRSPTVRCERFAAATREGVASKSVWRASLTFLATSSITLSLSLIHI